MVMVVMLSAERARAVRVQLPEHQASPVGIVIEGASVLLPIAPGSCARPRVK